MPNPAELLRAANLSRGLGTMATMPLSGIGNVAGWIGRRFGAKIEPAAGSRFVQKYIEDPIVGGIERISSGVGQALGELPGVGRAFKKTLSPEDIAFAAKRMNLSDTQMADLVRRAHAGELVTHRLTAPFEGEIFKKWVVPGAAVAYATKKLHETPESLTREALRAQYGQLQQRAGETRLKNLRQYAGMKTAAQTLEFGSMSQHNSSQNPQEALLQKSASMMQNLTNELRQATLEKQAYARAIGLYKQAADLVGQGVLEADRINDFVGHNLQKEGLGDISMSAGPSMPSAPSVNPPAPTTNNVSTAAPAPMDTNPSDASTFNAGAMGKTGGLLDLLSETQSTIPKHAQLGSLHEPERVSSGRFKAENDVARRASGPSATEMFNDFISSGDSHEF